MKRIPLYSSLFILLVALCAAAPVARADTETGVVTDATLLVGFPFAEEDPGSEGVLVVPGTVIPYTGPAEPRRAAAHLDLDREGARSLSTSRLSGHLSSTFRLSRVEPVYRQTETLAVNDSRELPAPSATSSVRIEVELLGFDRKSATYRVRFRDGGSVLADSRVAAVRGERTVIGGVDGEEAPYLFLVLEPRRATGEPRMVSSENGIQAPRVLHKENPAYTPDAREARITGMVIIQAVIDEAGTVEEARVLKGLPMGLSEAALAAIRQWTFEPARDADGNPVAVYYNLTVNFTLDGAKKEPI